MLGMYSLAVRSYEVPSASALRYCRGLVGAFLTAVVLRDQLREIWIDAEKHAPADVLLDHALDVMKRLIDLAQLTVDDRKREVDHRRRR